MRLFLFLLALIFFMPVAHAGVPRCYDEKLGSFENRVDVALYNKCFLSEEDFAVTALEFLFSFKGENKDRHFQEARKLFASEEAWLDFVESNSVRLHKNSYDAIAIKRPDADMIIEYVKTNSSYSKVRVVVPIYLSFERMDQGIARSRRTSLKVVRLSYEGEISRNRRILNDVGGTYRQQYDYRITSLEILDKEEYEKLYKEVRMVPRSLFNKLQFWKD